MPRKASKNSPRNYFTQETEDYIVKYNNCEDQNEKNKIFTDHLYYPFYKLAENIIHTFKFYHTDVDQIEDLKLDIVTMILQEKISYFDPTRGAKAFSYFGTIVKRWLIAVSKKNYLKISKQVSLDRCENHFDSEVEIETADRMSLSDFIDKWIVSVESRIDTLFVKDQDKQIAEAILTVFKSRKDPSMIFQKKALYVYVREITNYETPSITKVILKLKEDFYSKFHPLIEEGLIDLSQ